MYAFKKIHLLFHREREREYFKKNQVKKKRNVGVNITLGNESKRIYNLLFLFLQNFKHKTRQDNERIG